MEETFEALTADDEVDAGIESAGEPVPPAPPLKTLVSGVYEWKLTGQKAEPVPLSPVPGIRPIRREELRLDVDRYYPQLAASGTIHGTVASQIHWIARLKPTGPSRWAGPIWYKDGASASFPYTRVT